MVGLIGEKIGMTQIFDSNGKSTPVTVVKAGPCRVIQRKLKDKDGYNSVQLGYGEIKEKSLNKAQLGHFKKHNSKPYKVYKEFKLSLYKDIEEGEDFDVSMFKEKELVQIQGTSKGKGFAGVMKRHGFHGAKMSHGVHESFRGPGAIGQCATPSRVHKGKKLPGHKGTETISVKNLEIMRVDQDNNLLFIKGAVPGHRHSIVLLKKELY